MAPRQRAAVSGRGKNAKSTASLRKTSAASPPESERPNGQTKRRHYYNMLDEPSEEEKVIAGGNSKRPIEIKAPTSIAARKRRRETLSMAEIFTESSKIEEVPKDHAAEFVAGSTALYTWGAPTSQPVPAVRNERRHKGLRGLGLRRGKDSAFVQFMFGSGVDEGSDDTETPFRFLDLPLEIRWKIYGYLLIHPKPILLHSNWKHVHVNSPQDHTILRASKQILLESTQFLYEKNVFHAVVSSSPARRSYPTGGFIKKEFLPYLRNAIVECRFDWPSAMSETNMVGPIATCLSTLVMNEALLDSLTLVMTPVTHLTGPSSALVLTHPMVVKPIPEYFKAPASKIMRVIPKLRCKILNIIIRMPDRKRVLVSLNLRGLPVNQDKGGWLAGERVAKLTAGKLAHQVKMDLVGLGKRFEDIFENPEKAIMEGKARFMEEGESQADGLRLASRVQD
jgi:hypothetical protein